VENRNIRAIYAKILERLCNIVYRFPEPIHFRSYGGNMYITKVKSIPKNCRATVDYGIHPTLTDEFSAYRFSDLSMKLVLTFMTKPHPHLSKDNNPQHDDNNSSSDDDDDDGVVAESKGRSGYAVGTLELEIKNAEVKSISP